jgi:hypothetical protein
VSLFAFTARNRPFIKGDIALERTGFHLRVALLLTLFTFCPPGPELREKVNSISESGMESSIFVSKRTFSTDPVCHRQNERPTLESASPQQTGNRRHLYRCGRKVRASQSAVPANGRGVRYNAEVTESATENIPLKIVTLEDAILSKGEKAR